MKYTYLTIVLIVLAACQQGNDLDAKKKSLEEAKNELVELRAKIAELEKEIHAEDPDFSKNSNAVAITTLGVEKKAFEHFTEVRGAVESRKNVTLSAAAGGTIKKIAVREGQKVTAGQTLVELDTDILRNSLAEIKTQLDLANIVYDKQEKLWDQKIGTEMQYLQAKNQKESLERRLSTTQAQVNQMVIKAPFTGTVDLISALLGELAAPGMPLVRLVSADDMYVKADVSEEYIGKFKAGEPVEVFIPALNEKVKSIISSVGQVINPENRTFTMEVKLPGVSVKPNQVTIIKFRDYVNPEVFTVPTKLIQRDNQGQFVYIVSKDAENVVAKKQYITPGFSYDSKTEVLDGLTGNEQIIFEGFRDVTEGAEVAIAAETSPKKEVAKNKE